ncbi:hypothetical protein BURC_03787 [Burkholderiaceae bacterium]|nr:hypothetical protein BURC_03787 [Burkholderiaceae bacterium]
MSSPTTGVQASPPRRAGFWPAAVAAMAMMLLGAGAQAAEDNALSSEDKACLECHQKPGLAKTLGNGEKMSLHVAPKRFADSAHGSSGCEGCHAEIDINDHGKEPKPIASKREHARGMMETCRDCHKKTVKLYEDSVHSALVKTGSEKAPICSDCHNPHDTPLAKEGNGHADPLQCHQCHEKIAVALKDSVHGQSEDEALVCKDCHRTHNIKAASHGDHLKGQCLSCHRDSAATHKAWLPNAERHLEAISCEACHSPGAKRRVNLRLYDVASQTQVTEKVGVPQFKRLAHAADEQGKGLDARALWSLLQEFNNNGSESKMALRGRLEVQTGEEAHRLGAKAHAVKECDTCHREGAESFQSVSVSMVGPDGRPLRHDASKGVLTSVESIGSIGGFYAIGSTRIKLLDTLLLMALAAGILFPTAHFTVKWLSKRARARQAAADASNPQE